MTNERVDELVLASIRDGAKTFSDIAEKVVVENFRVIDKALQRLRRRNQIHRAGVPLRWCIGVAKKMCPACKGSEWTS